MDLFKVNWIRKLYKSPWFPLVPQCLTLIAFALLIYGALGITTPDETFAKTLRNTNLSNLIIWSYWWPLIIIAAVVFGRHWCTICPMELITTLMGKIGLKKKPGRILKSGWVITLFYAIILIIGIHTFAIHRIPHYMAIYMLLLFFTAIASGLVWEKRTFCTHICPVGHLLGIYSLLSVTRWRVKNQNTCKECKTKECTAKNRHYKIIARSCTSNLYPAEIKDNRSCILCSQCHKSCPNDNLALKLRKPSANLLSATKLSGAEIAFILMVSGFVIYEIFVEWKVSKKIILAAPSYINDILGISPPWTGTSMAIILYVLFPWLFFFLFGGLRRLFGKETFKDSITAIALAILPIMGAMHILKALFKTTSRIPYWSYIAGDPTGVATATSILNSSLKLDKSVIAALAPYLSIAAILLALLALIFSALIIIKSKKGTISQKIITIAAALVYLGFFAVTLIIWRF